VLVDGLDFDLLDPACVLARRVFLATREHAPEGRDVEVVRLGAARPARFRQTLLAIVYGSFAVTISSTT